MNKWQHDNLGVNNERERQEHMRNRKPYRNKKQKAFAKTIAKRREDGAWSASGASVSTH